MKLFTYVPLNSEVFEPMKPAALTSYEHLGV